MYWTLELASKLEDAPWPATKDELIDYAMRSGAPLEVIENLQEMEDEGEIYESIEDIWPDYPSKEDFFFNEEEYWYRMTLNIQVLWSGRNGYMEWVIEKLLIFCAEYDKGWFFVNTNPKVFLCAFGNYRYNNYIKFLFIDSIIIFYDLAQ